MNDAALPMHAPNPASTSLAAARNAQAGWADVPVAGRLRVIRQFRKLLARDASALAATLARPVEDTLVAEILPLAEAARFLERDAVRLLAPRRLGGRLGGGRPLWLIGVRAEIRREPVGVVLVLAPSNYPIFLPGAQILQALAAGNAVCAKPAPGCTAPLARLAALLKEAGLPRGLLTVLRETVQDGAEAVRAGFDRIVLTGSAGTGRAVLAAAAGTLTPCTMELSGSDAVFVLPGADLDLVASSLAYGLRLNGGATCIAPRRVFVPRELAAPLEQALLARVSALPAVSVAAPVRARLMELLAEARVGGGRIHGEADGATMTPVIVADASPTWRLLQEDVFAPVLSIVPVTDTAAALAAASACPYALGASIFGPENEAQALAGRVRAGSVVINDVIVPTADPRLPFGGRGESGFGTTRGAEGLLEMTVIKTVSTRRGRFRPHLVPSGPDAARQFAAMVGLLHGPGSTRLAALRSLVSRQTGR